MDSFDELERMAQNAAAIQQSDETSAEEIARWQKLFSYSYDQAAELIEQHNNDLTIARLSNQHWEIIRANLEAQGHDRSAYEHELALGGKRTTQRNPSKILISARDARASYVFKMEGPLGNAEAVRAAGNLCHVPETVQGEGDDGDATFCTINGLEKQAILVWLSTNALTFVPTFARLTGRPPRTFQRPLNIRHWESTARFHKIGSLLRQ